MSRRFAGYGANTPTMDKVGRSGLTESEWWDRYRRLRARQMKYVSSGICKEIGCDYLTVAWETITDCSLRTNDFLSLCPIDNKPKQGGKK